MRDWLLVLSLYSVIMTAWWIRVLWQNAHLDMALRKYRFDRGLDDLPEPPPWIREWERRHQR